MKVVRQDHDGVDMKRTPRHFSPERRPPLPDPRRVGEQVYSAEGHHGEEMRGSFRAIATVSHGSVRVSRVGWCGPVVLGCGVPQPNLHRSTVFAKPEGYPMNCWNTGPDSGDRFYENAAKNHQSNGPMPFIDQARLKGAPFPRLSLACPDALSPLYGPTPARFDPGIYRCLRASLFARHS